MTIVVKVVAKDNGDEPVVDPNQDAPILDENSAEMPWNEGTVNDGHEDLPPPPPVTGEESSIPENQADTESGNLPQPPPSNDSLAGTVEPIQSGDIGAQDGDGVLPSDDGTQLDAGVDAEADAPPPPTSQGEPDAPPETVGEPEASQAECDEQAEEPDVQTDEGQAEETKAVDTGTLTVDKEMVSHGKAVGNTSESEPVKLEAVIGDAAKVGYSCGFTKNIGEFNSLRATVSIELPCAPNATEIEKTYELAVQFVDDKLQSLWQDA